MSGNGCFGVERVFFMGAGVAVGSDGVALEFVEDRIRSGRAGTAKRGSEDALFFPSLGIEVYVKGSMGHGVSRIKIINDEPRKTYKRTHH